MASNPDAKLGSPRVGTDTISMPETTGTSRGLVPSWTAKEPGGKVGAESVMTRSRWVSTAFGVAQAHGVCSLP